MIILGVVSVEAATTHLIHKPSVNPLIEVCGFQIEGP
jgi:hypothetical protein